MELYLDPTNTTYTNIPDALHLRCKQRQSRIIFVENK